MSGDRATQVPCQQQTAEYGRSRQEIHGNAHELGDPNPLHQFDRVAEGNRAFDRRPEA